MGGGCVSKPCGIEHFDLNQLIVQSSTARNFTGFQPDAASGSPGECLLFLECVRGLAYRDDPSEAGLAQDAEDEGNLDRDDTADLSQTRVESPSHNETPHPHQPDSLSRAPATPASRAPTPSSPSGRRRRQRLVVRAWAKNDEGELIGRVAEWPAKSFLETPSWYSAKSLGFALGESRSATLCIEIRREGAKQALGSLSQPLADLPHHSVVTRKLALVAKQSPSVSFQLLLSEAVTGPRTVYFVRHAESAWNIAQSNRNLYHMMRTTDHPLSRGGREQAEGLAGRIAAAVEAGDRHGLAISQADLVFVSPLTRTVQTAVFGLGPALSKRGPGAELVLMANAREKQGLGGMDTRSKKLGVEILRSAFNASSEAHSDGGAASAAEAFSPLRFDVADVLDRWWCEGRKESDAQLQERLEQFMDQLMYSPAKTVVVVGHSLFFKEAFKRFLSPDCRAPSPSLTQELRASKLMNCGVACLRLEPASGQDAKPIVEVELVLESHVEKASSKRQGGQALPASPSEQTLGSTFGSKAFGSTLGSQDLRVLSPSGSPGQSPKPSQTGDVAWSSPDESSVGGSSIGPVRNEAPEVPPAREEERELSCATEGSAEPETSPLLVAPATEQAAPRPSH